MVPFNQESIEDLLVGAGLTQKQLAKELSTGQAYISRLRVGAMCNPTAKTLDKLYAIAAKYNLDLEFYSSPKDKK